MVRRSRARSGLRQMDGQMLRWARQQLAHSTFGMAHGKRCGRCMAPVVRTVSTSVRFARRNLRYPLFDVFDRPDAGASCPQRNRSTTAIQSLQMLNSELSNRCASALNQRVSLAANAMDPNTADRWIDRLFLLTLSRHSTAEEVTLLTPFFLDESSRYAACLAILNSNEFLTVD